MGFQNIGCPAGDFSQESITQYLKIYFPKWLKTYNFENYSNYIFTAEINNSKGNLDLLRSDQGQYLLEKKKGNNSFVTTELLNLGYFVQWIEEAFKTNTETSQQPDFNRYKQWFETNDDFNTDSNQNFLLNLKNKKPLSQPQFDDIIFNKIDSLSKNEAMYFLTLMYLDFIKTKEFLNSKLEPLPKEKKITISDKEYNNLKEMFSYPNTYDDCINVLKTVDPPVISIKNRYIGKEKGALVVWVDFLKRFDLIDNLQNETYSKLISKAFNFSISTESFRKVPKRAKDRYETDFNLLLSQVYQSVKSGK